MASNASCEDHNTDSSSCESSSSSTSSEDLELSYNSSTFEGSGGSTSDDEVHPFMYEPLASSSSDEDSEDNDGTDPRLTNLNW